MNLKFKGFLKRPRCKALGSPPCSLGAHNHGDIDLVFMALLAGSLPLILLEIYGQTLKSDQQVATDLYEEFRPKLSNEKDEQVRVYGERIAMPPRLDYGAYRQNDSYPRRHEMLDALCIVLKRMRHTVYFERIWSEKCSFQD